MIFQGLRRHVGHRSDSCGGVELAIVDLVHQLGNSEISQLDHETISASRLLEDVVWLDVPVKDAEAVDVL